MSLITRCPACGTLFKVVADQLKMSQGWVRCGQCAEVFDAQGHMASGVSVPSASSPLQAEIPTVVTDALATDADAHEDAVVPIAAAQAQREPEPLLVSEPEPLPVSEPKPEPVSESAHSQNQVLEDKQDKTTDVIVASPKAAQTLSDFSDSNWYNTVNPPAPRSRADFVDSSLPGAASSLSPNPSADELAAVGANSVPAVLPPMDRPSLLPAGVPAAVPVGELPSFVRQAQRAQRWRSPWVRALLLLVAGVLLAALAAQIAVQERDRIASQEPRALPWLQQLCTALGCTVGPLKLIDAVVVDASSFNKLRSDGKWELYKLALSLKNTSALSVAVPHIELSLNDAQDQPVLRRVLNPADLGTAQSVLAPAAELAGTSTIQVDSSQLAGARIAGYRVWAFYP